MDASSSRFELMSAVIAFEVDAQGEGTRRSLANSVRKELRSAKDLSREP